MLHLHARLQAAADLVPPGARLMDVGTDHARLPAALLQQGRIVSAVASDIETGPLERAAKTLETVGLRDRVTLLQRDGLMGIDPAWGDTVTITGMGGETIADILRPHRWTKTGVTLILQPTTGADALRRFLQEAGYRVEREVLTKDAGRLYQTLRCRGGAQDYAHPAHYYTGTLLGDDPLFPELLQKLERRFDKARAGLAKGEGNEEKLREFTELLAEVRRLQCEK